MTKPTVDASHADGNVFIVAGAVKQALRRVGMHAEAETVYELMSTSSSYDVALARFSELVDFNFGSSLEDEDEDEDEDDYDFDDQGEDE
jgi:hypothetical protein